ncbi:MAG TPA: VanZ family protein [Candidatus Limnocylindrales bacterium]|nr:VanZ family protein [Candidatus Limnocylindrales bacterium]
MMNRKNQPTDFLLQSEAGAWRNRILIAALTGIFFLTLYPFRFSLHTSLPAGRSPFLLDTWNQMKSPLPLFLNVLLFMPFGLGLALQFRSRGISWVLTILYTCVAGAFLSYTIEFSQIYIPRRDSGWEDILTNSSGSLVGSLLLAFPGQSILAALNRLERAIEAWLSVDRAAVILLAFLALAFGTSARWQAEASIRDWDEHCYLVIGNDATGHHSWPGSVSRLQIWNRAIPNGSAEDVTLGRDPGNRIPLPLVDFHPSADPLRQDAGGLSIHLSRFPSQTPTFAGALGASDDQSWLATTAPVSDLIHSLREANRFSIHAVVVPETSDSSGRIFSLSEPSGLSDLYLRQEGRGLVFWFRNGVSVKRAILAWTIPDVVSPHRPTDILFAFDGSVLRLWIDGKGYPEYRLSPGTAFAQWIRYVKVAELDGYQDIYYAALFVPVGVLLGIAMRKPSSRGTAGIALLIFGGIVAPLVLEMILVRVSRRPFSAGELVQSALLVIAGFLWINTDAWITRQSG